MIGRKVSLKDAATAGCGPLSPGVYVLYLNERVMKVGSAKIGIQKRMQQYYDRNPWCGLNKYITEDIVDQIKVSYQLCPSSACEELESKLFDKYGPMEMLPWAQRRPHNSKNLYVLYI